MARRGTKGHSDGLKVLLGSPQRFQKRIGDPELHPAPESAPAPSSVGHGAGKREWDRLYPELQASGVLMATDIQAFTTYCEIVGQKATLTRKARELGTSEAIRQGIMKALAVLRTQQRQYASELGLTPASRRGVKRGQEKKEPTKAERYFT